MRTFLHMDEQMHKCCEELDDIDQSIAEMVAKGCTNRDIARELHMAYQTVRNRMTRIFDVTGAANRTQLAVMWLTNRA